MKVVVLTGAGISAESGLPTFRDADGLWEGHDPMTVATPEAFEDDPDLVQRFYDERRAALGRVEPNAAHVALARLEERLGDDLYLVTQNIDDLHERGGSTRVHHMHGRLRAAWCTTCDQRHEWTDDPARPAAVPDLRPADAATRRRLVRRGPPRHGRRAARPVRVRPVRGDRHLGPRLPGGRVRALRHRRRRGHPRAEPRPRRGQRLRPGTAGARRPRRCPRGWRRCWREHSLSFVAAASIES